MDRFSFPKSIDPLESVMLPLAKVKFPTVEPVARVATPVLRVPVVDKFSSPNDIAPSESIILPVDIVTVPSIIAISVTVKSSVVVNCSADIVALDVTFPVTVCAPEARVPLVDKFSSPKDIDPPESVILPLANVRLPTVDPVASEAAPALNVPVVDTFSSPKDIDPPESVILPLASVRLPTVEPVGNEAACENVTPPPSAIAIASSPSVYSIKGVLRDVEATWDCVVMEVAPVTTPASTLIVPSNTIADPGAGVIFTAPEDVLNVTAASP